MYNIIRIRLAPKLVPALPTCLRRQVTRKFTVLSRGITAHTSTNDIAYCQDLALRTHSTVDAKGLLQPKNDELGTPVDTGTLFIVKVPHIGRDVKHSKIQQWHKQRGDEVDVGDLICVLETDQVLVNVQSQLSGTIVETVGNEGCRVKVGADLIIIRRPTEENEDELETEEECEHESY
ncbi:Biotin-requiring enzyme family protein [Babesia bovis T2Bo]|uniref:Lipoamide acyltransferase component of branched-chain alpha-keto acid dehydrogenase complex, mitochondrial n=1 Tax=Babesia bovis TaxID=5865 RepID=A7AMV7_BABBO|nr:Biotin-requiring enzyme family protein [Babesia bovis T2Bo]EDO07891.1 Biotin-requiring enzyme family protein [Babesia bovis T2Bo]|eukprot:XP_001611459.1 biotin-requiring enzyme family protein [Babesia bovis T2Bo]